MKLKLLLMSFILSITAVSSYAEEADSDGNDVNILFYDNFEQYFSGIPSGWSIEDPKSVEAYVSKDAQGRCAKVISTEILYDAALKRFFANPVESGIVYAHMKIKTPDVVFKRSMFAFRDTANRECQTVMFDKDGYIKTANGITIMQYQPDVWYDLVVRFDMDNKLYSLWIDNECVVENDALAAPEVINLYYFKFAQLERSNSYCYMDDIYAYCGDVVLGEQEIKDKYFFSYSDTDSSWARQEIENFVVNHITSRTEDGKFYPEENVTKKEFTQWLRGSMGLSEQTYVGMCSDVTAEDEVSGSIMALVVAGASGPYPGKWHPDNDVTLGEALEMLIEGYKYQTNMLPGEPEKTFKTLQEKGAWSRDFEAQADAIKLCENVKGIDQAQGNSDKVLTRAQAVKILTNYQNAVNKKD